jgi:hypothetical protein
MEKYEMALEELEAQRVELLPDRIEMKRNGRGNRLRCNNANVNFDPGLLLGNNNDFDSLASGNQVCLLQS